MNESDATSPLPFIILIGCMVASIAACSFKLGLYLGRNERAQAHVEDLKVLCERLLRREQELTAALAMKSATKEGN